jgi:arylsulfatase A-like enzyme
VCSASRAALLTGCYPERVSILGALWPQARHGINPDELTLAELCKQRGYATAIFGKWHLGHHEPFLPLQHGFDEYFGLPYSNDMWPNHPESANLGPHVAQHKHLFPELPLLEDNRVVNPEVSAHDQEQLTTWYTQRAIDFIERTVAGRSEAGYRPFFLYVPHTMVHVPLFVSDKFWGRSGVGLYGDVVMEIDWSVGQILDALERHHIDRETLVIFTSDNGPWLRYGNHAGSAGPLREGKGTVFEGGTRVPCIMRWPGKIPAGTSCDELSTTMDVLPTVARLIGADLPTDRVLDGKDIWPLMSGEPNARSPHEAFWCYWGGALHGVRDRRWKLHLPHPYESMAGRRGGRDGTPVPAQEAQIGLALYDLKTDVGETINVAERHPEIVARLMEHVEAARAALGDTLTGQVGSEVRPPGKLDEP